MRYLPIAVVVGIVLAGCGSGGGGGGAPVTGGQPSSGLGSVQVLDIDDGATTQQTETYVPTSAPAGSIAFRRVEAGNSRQGSPGGSVGHQSDEPIAVRSVGAFYLAATELTQGQWQAIVAKAGSGGDTGRMSPWTLAVPDAAVDAGALGSTKPAYGLPYDLVTAMLLAYNNAVGATLPQLRLPTNAEWEHACRAGSTARYSWGEVEDVGTVGDHAVVRETLGGTRGLRTVGGRAANAFGFHDMHGNVWEWVADGAISEGNVLRGGGWSDNLLSARCANRTHLDPEGVHHGHAGVRLVMVLP